MNLADEARLQSRGDKIIQISWTTGFKHQASRQVAIDADVDALSNCAQRIIGGDFGAEMQRIIQVKYRASFLNVVSIICQLYSC